MRVRQGGHAVQRWKFEIERARSVERRKEIEIERNKPSKLEYVFSSPFHRALCSIERRQETIDFSLASRRNTLEEAVHNEEKKEKTGQSTSRFRSSILFLGPNFFHFFLLFLSSWCPWVLDSLRRAARNETKKKIWERKRGRERIREESQVPNTHKIKRVSIVRLEAWGRHRIWVWRFPCSDSPTIPGGRASVTFRKRKEKAEAIAIGVIWVVWVWHTWTHPFLFSRTRFLFQSLIGFN